jgi:hypothetical protein
VKGKQIVIDEIVQIGALHCFGEFPTELCNKTFQFLQNWAL